MRLEIKEPCGKRSLPWNVWTCGSRRRQCPWAPFLRPTLRVESRQLHRLQASLERAQPGSRHERTLSNRIAAEERMMGRQTVRLDRIVARAGGTGTGSQSIFPANVSPTLGVIYDAYEQNPGGFPANLSGTAASLVVIQGSNVGIQVHDSNPADFDHLLTELENAGVQVTSSSAYVRYDRGYAANLTAPGRCHAARGAERHATLPADVEVSEIRRPPVELGQWIVNKRVDSIASTPVQHA